MAGAALLAVASAGLLVSCLTTRRPALAPEVDPLLLGFDGAQPKLDIGVVPGAKSAAIAVPGPYLLVEPETRATARGEALAQTQVEAPAAGGLAIGAWRYDADELEIVPEQPTTPVIVEGRRYLGSLRIVRREGVAGASPAGSEPLPPPEVAVINRVGMEDYLTGVLGAEMPLSWPDPALQAQAVAARTYALYHLRVRAHSQPLFHVRADTRSQVYRGLDYPRPADLERARKLVADTQGVVLAWRDRIFQAFFSSTCGGKTTSALAYFGAPDITPLAGNECGFCEKSSHATWETVFTPEEVATGLRAKKLGAPADLADLLVVDRDPAGRATRVALVAADGASLTMSASELRLAVGPGKIKSTWFEIENQPADGTAGGENEPAGRFVFRGKGWGHGVGFCQWGARGMADAGHDAEAILRRYYPGAQIVRAY